MTWSEFLSYLTQPNGIAAGVGLALMFLVQYVPPYQALAPRYQRLVFLALCLLLPVVAAGLGILTAGWSASWEVTFWPALVAGALAFSTGTVAHSRWLATTREP